MGRRGEFSGGQAEIQPPGATARGEASTRNRVGTHLLGALPIRIGESRKPALVERPFVLRVHVGAAVR